MGCAETQGIIDCITCEQGTEVPASSSCGCSCTPATPTPYYKQANACEQSHKHIVIQNQFALGVTIANSFNMPLCNETVRIVIPGLQLVVLGSYLWNPSYGYLKIISFDAGTESVIVENECQTGNAAPGTLIPACTVFSAVDTPIGTENPCNAVTTTEGVLLVCDGSDTKPLAPSAAGQVPISTGTGNEVAFQTIELPLVACTTLSADLTLLLGNSGPYVLIVADTSIFQVNDLVRIANRTDRFTVTHITSGIQFEATVSPAPAGIDVIPAGTAVCQAPCCEQIAADLTYFATHPCTWDLSTRMAASHNTGYIIDPNVDVSPAGSQVTNFCTLILPNLVCRPLAMRILTQYGCELMLHSEVTPDYCVYAFYPSFAINLCAIGAHTHAALTPLDTCTREFDTVRGIHGPELFDYFRFTYPTVITVPVGQEVVIDARLGFGYLQAGDAGDVISLINQRISHQTLEVAV